MPKPDVSWAMEDDCHVSIELCYQPFGSTYVGTPRINQSQQGSSATAPLTARKYSAPDRLLTPSTFPAEERFPSLKPAAAFVSSWNKKSPQCVSASTSIADLFPPKRPQREVTLAEKVALSAPPTICISSSPVTQCPDVWLPEGNVRQPLPASTVQCEHLSSSSPWWQQKAEVESLRLRGIIIPPPPPPPALRHPVKADADLSRQGGGVQSVSEHILGTPAKTKCPASCPDFDVQPATDISVEEIIPVSRRMKTMLLRKQCEIRDTSGCSNVSVINDASDPMRLKVVGTLENIRMAKA